jgi:hypothetical protein
LAGRRDAQAAEIEEAFLAEAGPELGSGANNVKVTFRS